MIFIQEAKAETTWNSIPDTTGGKPQNRTLHKQYKPYTTVHLTKTVFTAPLWYPLSLLSRHLYI